MAARLAKLYPENQMPIYEYQCQSCGHELEAFQRLSDEPLKDCPSCNQPSLNKRISAAGFRLKGGGWYETDFKSGSDKKRNLAGSESTASASTDSKPATETKSSSATN